MYFVSYVLHSPFCILYLCLYLYLQELSSNEVVIITCQITVCVVFISMSLFLRSVFPLSGLFKKQTSKSVLNPNVCHMPYVPYIPFVCCVSMAILYLFCLRHKRPRLCRAQISAITRATSHLTVSMNNLS